MSTTTPNGRPRTPRRSTEETEQIAQLLAARDRLDADQAERRRREEEAFASYAAASSEVAEFAADRDAALAALDAQRDAAVRDAEAKIGTAQDRQGAVLVELNRLGRSAEDLSVLFGIPAKRVRSTIRGIRQPEPTAVGSVDPTPESPERAESEPVASDRG